MRKKNLTPFGFATKLTSRRPPQPEVTVVVRGRFALAPGVLVAHADQGRLSGELFDEDDAECTGGCSKPGDLADLKQRAEVLLTGVCHAPGGKPTGETFLRAAVRDAAGKALVTIDRRIFGQRVWTESLLGKAFTDPIPFTRMGIGWANAFGGPGHADNPVGKGLASHELPNVEWADAIQRRGDRPRPACPGPISPFWPARASRVGREYGGTYAEQRAPFYAADFDWGHFQAAPVEQQLDGFFRGDERLELVNLHPKISNLDAELPSLRVRVFLRDVRDRFREVPVVLDTIHVDSGEGFVDLTWRGVGEATELDLTDLAYAIIASEPLGEPPLPVTHYEEMMSGFVADPIGMRDAIPPELRPVFDRAMALADEREKGEPPAAPGLDPLDAEIARASRLLDPEQATALVRAVAELRSRARELHEQAAAGAREAGKPPPPPLDEALVAAVAEVRKPRKPAVDFAPDGSPRIALSGIVTAQRELLETMRQQSELPPEARAQIDAAEAHLGDPRLAELDPSLVGGAPLVEPGPGADLRRRDLRGQDLSGADLSRCDLRGALLSGADLRGANLQEALFEHAQANQASLAGADLRGAKLDGGVFLEADLSGARLERATLDRAVFVRAKLDGADLSGAKGQLVMFAKASLRGARGHGLDLLQSDLSDCDLTDADLRGASLLRCQLGDAKARGASFEACRLGHASFQSADLSGARFVRASGPFTSFMKATVDETDFAHTVFPGAHFSQARGKATRLFAANLPESRFQRARLEAASFECANLMSADLCDALVTRSSFRGANLYDAKFLRTAGEGCDFVDANLTRSTLEGA